MSGFACFCPYSRISQEVMDQFIQNLGKWFGSVLMSDRSGFKVFPKIVQRFFNENF